MGLSWGWPGWTIEGGINKVDPREVRYGEIRRLLSVIFPAFQVFVAICLDNQPCSFNVYIRR